MNFYKSVIEFKGKLLVRGVHEGQEYKEKIDFSPTLYSLTQQQTEFKTLQGQFLKPITFKTIDDANSPTVKVDESLKFTFLDQI